MARALLPRYANAQMISFTDTRMTANYVTYDSSGDNSGKMRGYLVKPASDRVYPVGGYPGNDDDGKKLQRGLDQDKLQMDILNSAKFLKSHELSTGKIGATGFCWGGGAVNKLAVSLGADMQAGVPFYGAAAKSGVGKIQAPLMI